MRLVTYRKGSSKPRVGALLNDAVLDLGALAADLARERGAVRRGRGDFPRRCSSSSRAAPEVLALAREALSHGEAVLKRDGVAALTERKLGAPADKIAAGGAHPAPGPQRLLPRPQLQGARRRARRRRAPPHPVYFTKAPETVVGAGRQGDPPRGDQGARLRGRADGGHRHRPAATSRASSALQHVFGYTIINDVTARDLQKRHGQWFKGKSLDTFCPMGPVLVTADEIADPADPRRSPCGSTARRASRAIPPR